MLSKQSNILPYVQILCLCEVILGPLPSTSSPLKNEVHLKIKRTSIISTPKHYECPTFNLSQSFVIETDRKKNFVSSFGIIRCWIWQHWTCIIYKCVGVVPRYVVWWSFGSLVTVSSALWTHFPWVIMRHVNFTDDLQTREDFCSFVLKSSKLREWTHVKNCCSALSVHSSISKANGTTYNVL